MNEVDGQVLAARVRAARERRGWTQGHLAERAGTSRQTIGALEAGRHLPRVDVALGLARALGTTVDALLTTVPDAEILAVLGGPPPTTAVRAAYVAERLVVTPVVAEEGSWLPPDGIVEDGRFRPLPRASPDGFVVVGCDPALAILERLGPGGRGGGQRGRLVAVVAASRAASAAVTEGRAHAAVVHDHHLDPPAEGHVVPLARWRTGLAGPPGGEGRVAAALEGRGPVIQREAGAAAQAAFVRALPEGADVGGPRARGHLDAARQAAATGLPAVTIEPAALVLGLSFHPLETHRVELRIAEHAWDHPGAQALGELLVSADVHRRLKALPAYEPGAA